MVLNNQLIVLYDGTCGFCSRTVQFVLKYGDKNIMFSPLGSNVSDLIFAQAKIQSPDLETFYFFRKGELFERSRAGFQLARYLKFPYNLIAVFRIFPLWITDPGYNLVARNRKKLAGESCLLPTMEERNRFIEEI